MTGAGSSKMPVLAEFILLWKTQFLHQNISKSKQIPISEKSWSLKNHINYIYTYVEHSTQCAKIWNKLKINQKSIEINTHLYDIYWPLISVTIPTPQSVEFFHRFSGILYGHTCYKYGN